MFLGFIESYSRELCLPGEYERIMDLVTKMYLARDIVLLLVNMALFSPLLEMTGLQLASSFL